MAKVFYVGALLVALQAPVVGRTGSYQQGPRGVMGPTGYDGATGPRGFIGATGATGGTGRPGAMGSYGYRGKSPKGVTGETGMVGLGGGRTGATGGTGPVGHRGVIGRAGSPGPDGEINLAESQSVVTLELIWPACLTLLMSVFTTFLLMRYRRVMNDLQSQRKTYTVQFRAATRAQSIVTVASTDAHMTDIAESNYTAMDASSLKELTTS